MEAEDLAIFADVVRVEQIFWNLASNALKFTPPRGTVHLRLTRDGSWASLEVRDTGRGIDPIFLGHVFGMFQQGDHKPTTRREGGLGLGLVLVKSLAELHDGSVEAESEGLGKGAMFRVRLPLLEGTLGSDAPGFQLVSRQLLAGRRILLVDDDPHTLETHGELLSAEGAKVTTAESAYAALEKAEHGDFDLVVSDITMPGTDGLEMITRLRQLPHAVRSPSPASDGLRICRDPRQRASICT